jgi:PAS domain S-box-containing protein
VPVLFIGLLVLQAANPQGAFESWIVLLMLGLLFTTLASVVVSILVGRSFLTTGATGLLFLGTGALIWGIAAPIGPILFPGNDDAIIASHNLLAWCSAFCQLAGVIISAAPLRTVVSRELALTLACAIAAAVVAVVMVSVAAGWRPVFFVQGKGGTPIRQLVLAMATGMFASAAGLLWLRQRRTPTAFTQWYALGMLLIATGLFGVLIQSVHGGWVGWTARAAQFLGSAYMIVAARAAVRQSGAWKVSLEEAVRQSEDRYRALVELSPDAIFINRQGRIVFVNPAALSLFGASGPEQLVGKSPFDLFHPDCHALMREREARLLAGGSVPMAEEKIVKLDGTVTEVELAATAVEAEGGRAIQVIARDISERKEAERELRQAKAGLEIEVQKRTAKLSEAMVELEAFSYTVAHDLRAPLRAMHGFAGFLESNYQETLDEQGKQSLRRIISSAKRMDRLIQDVLGFTQAARADWGLEPVDAQKLLVNILESYPAFQERKGAITIDGGLPLVMGNEALLTQCFSNLIGNAVKFVPPGETPRVRVRAETVSSAEGELGNKQETQQSPRNGHDRAVRIWIEDNGIGIPKEGRERIFGPFQRLSQKYEGTGIGLAIVRKAVERMEGRVGVESEPGKGSRFWMELKCGSNGKESI